MPQHFVTKEFTFDAAHHLTDYYGKCEKPHGHTYKLQVTLTGKLSSNGLLLDFVLLKKVVTKHILAKLDHSNLNDHFPNPTCELIASWIWDQLEPISKLLQAELTDLNLGQEIQQYLAEPITKINLDQFNDQIRLYEIKLWETATSFATIRLKD